MLETRRGRLDPQAGDPDDARVQWWELKSQRPQAPDHAGPLLAVIGEARWHVRPFPVPSGHAADFAYKQAAAQR
jgi:hypothetical protein